ncbi:hypothetical protein BC962_2142 [Gillisia mitskevichiae]|uniref:Secreted protein n=1 Tax=Gillisia mitskevichiae TaxID=270921 RepID=A0A495PUI2_9FLAO|nr:hypothetical protein [Gillisia mitskevichiae]RKS53877.1 hypothetical protein BC962_2142 [Gillisia mitskevichiae]
MKYVFFLLLIIFTENSIAQDKTPTQVFWENLKEHCGKAFEGKLAESVENDSFSGKELIMYIWDCDDKTIKIPFYVGADKSRTWVLTLEDDHIKLKHDHRHEDGSEDAITQYGGESTNSGLDNLQFFPADEETASLIPAAASNVWWITLNENSFSYNLKRLGSERPQFTVTFDLKKPIKTPGAPWGAE